MVRWSAIPVVLLLGASSQESRAHERVVVAPFQSVARYSAARPVVMRAVEASLARKGYDVVKGDAVEKFLREQRIRYLDSLTTAQASALLEQLDADALVTGSVLVYDDRDADPEVAVALEAVGPDGVVLWSEARGITAAQTERLLGRGRAAGAEDLAKRVVADALDSLPERHLTRVRVRGPAGDGRSPRVFRSREVAGRQLRICLLPLQNLSSNRDAPRVMDAILQHRLAERAGMTVIQAADLRSAVVSAALRVPSQLTLEQLRSVSKTLGTSLFLRGAILTWAASGGTDTGTPEIEVYLNLVDAESGRILWSGLHRRTGLDYEGLLRLGTVRDETSLASRVVAELLDAFTQGGYQRAARQPVEEES